MHSPPFLSPPFIQSPSLRFHFSFCFFVLLSSTSVRTFTPVHRRPLIKEPTSVPVSGNEARRKCTISHAAVESARWTQRSVRKIFDCVNSELYISFGTFFFLCEQHSSRWNSYSQAFNSGLMRPADKLVPGPFHGDLIHSAASPRWHFPRLCRGLR